VDVAFDFVRGDVTVLFEELTDGGVEAGAYGVFVPRDVFVSGANFVLGIWDICLCHDGLFSCVLLVRYMLSVSLPASTMHIFE
jgi:hypothetical protein